MKGKNGFSVSATLAEHLGEKNALTKEEQNKVLKEINAKADSNEGMKALKDAQAKKTSKLGVMLGGLAVGLSGFNGGIRFDASDKNAVSQAKELAIDFGDRFSASGTSDSSKDLSVLFNQNETGSESEVDSKASEARQSISRSNAFTESNREKLELANKYSRSVKQSGEISRADLEGFAQNNPQKADQWLSEVTGGQVPNFRTSKQRSKRVANELSKLFNDPTSDNLNKAANLFSLMGEDRLESITRQNAEYDLDWSFTQPDVQKPQNNATKEIPLSTVDKPSKANGVEAEADRRAKNGQTKPSQVDPDEAINRFNDDVERGYFAHSTSDQLNNASAAASPVLKQGPNNLEQVDQQRLKSPLNKGVFDFGRDFLTLANSSIKALAMASNGISKTQAYIGSSLVAFADAYDNHLSGFGTSPDADSRRAEYQDKYGSIVDEIKSSAYYEMSKSIDDGTYNDFISDNQNATQVASELFDIRNNPIVENADTAAYELSRNPTFKSHFESASSKQSDLFDKIQGMDLNAYDVGASLVKTVGENAGEMAGDMLNGVFDIDGVNMSKQSENQLIEAANQFNNGTLYDAIGQKIETNEDQRKYVLDVLQNNDDTGYSTAIDEQFFNTDWLGGKGALEKIYDSQTNPGARRKGRR
ncbi:hypothetical protein A3715_21780 [Oleiphilus sp. HI0009]|nr:hypothetical protein A3715_21780 [Oleiphilus sp. HI0009]